MLKETIWKEVNVRNGVECKVICQLERPTEILKLNPCDLLILTWFVSKE